MSTTLGCRLAGAAGVSNPSSDLGSESNGAGSWLLQAYNTVCLISIDSFGSLQTSYTALGQFEKQTGSVSSEKPGSPQRAS